jgi:hypothetical protein
MPYEGLSTQPFASVGMLSCISIQVQGTVAQDPMYKRLWTATYNSLHYTQYRHHSTDASEGNIAIDIVGHVSRVHLALLYHLYLSERHYSIIHNTFRK